MGKLSTFVVVLFLGSWLWVACGGDDGGPPVTDAPAGQGDGPPGGQIDAGWIDAAGGGAGAGQFCNTLPDMTPMCQADLMCCADHVCRLPTDCAGGPGYLVCDEGSDCPGGLICCEIPQMTFCTKRSACAAYGGDEIP